MLPTTKGESHKYGFQRQKGTTAAAWAGVSGTNRLLIFVGTSNYTRKPRAGAPIQDNGYRKRAVLAAFCAQNPAG
jgi:hypothetical protein